MLKILSAPLLEEPGVYRLETISKAAVEQLVAEENEIISYIPQDSAAAVLSIMLNIYCPKNKGPIELSVGEKAVVFQLLGRIKDSSSIKSIEDMNVQYQFFLLEKIDTAL